MFRLFSLLFFFLMLPRPTRSTLFPYTTLFRSLEGAVLDGGPRQPRPARLPHGVLGAAFRAVRGGRTADLHAHRRRRSEEHTSELQSLRHLVCRLLLEKKNKNTHHASKNTHTKK